MGPWTEEFVSNVSHDILNTVGATAVLSELLDLELPANSPCRQYALQIQESCRQARQLVEIMRHPARWSQCQTSFLAMAKPGQTEISHAEVSAANTRALRLLIIDDQKLMADCLSLVLERLGHAAFAVYDPETALSLIAQTPHEWDAVISDRDTPGMSGEQVLDRARAVNRQLVTVLYTGSAPTAYGNTIDLVVKKPAVVADLIAAIRRCMGQQP